MSRYPYGSEYTKFETTPQAKVVMKAMAFGVGWLAYCCLKGVANLVNNSISAELHEAGITIEKDVK